MGRILIVVGILLIVLGGAGVLFGFVGLPTQFTSMITQATTPTAAELCEPGETLDEITGQSEYTPLEGYRSSVQYYCVDANGERRDVTGTFVQGMLGQAFGSMGSLAIPIVSSCLFIPGIILLIIGALISRRNVQTGNTVVRTYTVGSASPNRFDFPDDPSSPVQSNESSTDDLSRRLAKLDAVRNAGLITDAEYERARQEIINQMT